MPRGWSSYRSVTQAAGNTFAVLDNDFAGTNPPTVPSTLIPVPYQRKDHGSHVETKGLAFFVGLFNAANTKIGRGTLAFEAQLLTVHSDIDAGVTVVSDSVSLTGILPWRRFTFDAKGGTYALRVHSQVGAAAANFTQWRVYYELL